MHYFLNPDGETYTRDWETEGVEGKELREHMLARNLIEGFIS